MKSIQKIALVLTKILELLHWVGTASMAALAICSVAAGPWLSGLLERILPQYRPELNTYGYEMTVTNAAGAVEPRAVLLFGISAVFILSLMAMVFRNVHLILKKSQESTPFQPDNIRMLREIGIFCIVVPVIGLVMSAVSRLVQGLDAVETSVNLYGFSMGIIVLCLTKSFAHGAALEQDVEGLV